MSIADITTAAPRYLVDTNILLRAADATSPQHSAATGALATLTLSSASLHLAPQNLIEFWAVATRPVTENGLAQTTAVAATFLAYFKGNLDLLPDTAAIYSEWERLAATYGVSGKTTHDARLVAFMQVHGLTHLLTFDGGHFNRFADGEAITIVDPSVVPKVRA